MISVIGFAACLYFKVDVTLVYDSFLGITTATICWSFFIAFIVYIKARVQKTGLSPKGNTGRDRVIVITTVLPLLICKQQSRKKKRTKGRIIITHFFRVLLVPDFVSSSH